jgi:hypothetical protein
MQQIKGFSVVQWQNAAASISVTSLRAMTGEAAVQSPIIQIKSYKMTMCDGIIITDNTELHNRSGQCHSGRARSVPSLLD